MKRLYSIFFLSVLQVTADHGPAVSGAHNTIVTARAGKDLVSALCSGLLTIGPRFGGALDKAAEMFTQVRVRGRGGLVELPGVCWSLASLPACNVNGLTGTMTSGCVLARTPQGADEGADAAEYVKRMRQQNKLIMGIGHRIKSLSNPDMRVTIIKDYALKHFKNTKVLDFALAVEQVRRLDGRFVFRVFWG